MFEKTRKIRRARKGLASLYSVCCEAGIKTTIHDLDFPLRDQEIESLKKEVASLSPGEIVENATKIANLARY